jgi:hypothetical protein
MRPGRLLVVLLGAVCAATLLVPLRPGLVWLWLVALVATLGAAALEAVRMLGMTLSLERPGRLVLPLGVDETVAFALRTDASRPVFVELRQAQVKIAIFIKLIIILF